MKARVGCIPCFVKQGLSAVRLSTQDPAAQQRVLDEVLRRIQGLPLDETPALLSQVVYAAVREMTGVADPFAEARRRTNRAALALLPDLRRRIAAAPDPLHAAIKVALIGNVVDLGIAGHAFDLERDIAQGLDAALAVDDYPAFRAALEQRRTSAASAKPRLLYVCDNSGEIAFDRLLIEDLLARCEVTASVKSRPIINDATMQDAEEVGLPAIADVIETGSDDIGVNWARASREFAEAFRAADLVLAKGQGNFETLDETPGEIFFLLKAKCPEVAAEARRQRRRAGLPPQPLTPSSLGIPGSSPGCSGSLGHSAARSGRQEVIPIPRRQRYETGASSLLLDFLPASPPEPDERLGQDRAGMFAVVTAITVIQTIVVFGELQRCGHLQIRQRPVAPVAVQVVRPGLQEDADGLARCLADQRRIDVPAPDVGEAADVAEDFAERVGPLPRRIERADSAGAHPTDRPPRHFVRQPILRADRRKDFFHKEPDVLVAECVVLEAPIADRLLTLRHRRKMARIN